LEPPVIEKLSAFHQMEGFDCGRVELNRYLERYALPNQQAGSSTSYVAIQGDQVMGYYTLTVGSVTHQDAPARITRGMPRYPIPVMILARLAVEVRAPGLGVGSGLLKDALLRTSQAADIAGIRALLVHAKDDNAQQWYLRYDFDPSPTDPLHLFLLIKDIRNALS
jgi:GNAT superfamily N-acetyltransferase